MVEWLHWGRRSWNLFNMLYFEKNTNNKENLSGKMNVIKKYFFAPTLLTVLFLIGNSSMSCSTSLITSLKVCVGFPFFIPVFLLKFIFTLREQQITMNLLKKKLFLKIEIYTMQGWTATTRHEVTRKWLKHKKVKESRKSL